MTCEHQLYQECQISTGISASASAQPGIAQVYHDPGVQAGGRRAVAAQHRRHPSFLPTTRYSKFYHI